MNKNLKTTSKEVVIITQEMNLKIIRKEMGKQCRKKGQVVKNNVIVVFNMSGRKHAHDTFDLTNRQSCHYRKSMSLF